MAASNSVRIGILIDSLLSRYQLRLFHGVMRVAKARGARVVGFQGSYLKKPDSERPVFDGSFLYDLAGPDCVDGLIVAANVLASGVGIGAVNLLCQKSAVPVVSVGLVDGTPHIGVNNESGLRSLIEHLVQTHGRRHLAFIQGPPGNPDAAEREQAFRSTLASLRITVLDDCVLEGNFLEASGAAAVRKLFDTRGLLCESLDAIVAANDQMAVGAIEALTERGIRVPEDVSVVGFDDDAHGRNCTPPLTTVLQPVELVGERAAELLLRRIAGEPVPERTLMKAQPVWRRSCGCGTYQPRRLQSIFPGDTLSATLARRRNECLERVARRTGEPVDPTGVDALLTLLTAKSEQDAAIARDRLEEAILAGRERGLDPVGWLDVMLPMAEPVQRYTLTDPTEQQVAHARLLDAKLLVNEVAVRVRMLDQLHTMQRANAARVLGSALVCSRHIKALSRVLSTGLPKLGINYCSVCLFVEGGESGQARVVASYDSVTPQPIEPFQNAEQLWRAVPPSLPPSQYPSPAMESTFPVSALVPPKLAPTSDALDLLVYPLVFAEDSLGYVVFDAPVDMDRAWLLEGLAGHLSSAIYALEHTEALRRAREIAEMSNAAKSEFVATVSHEVRTPLNTIIGHLDLCLRTGLSRQQRRQLEGAQLASRALLEIINDILDFSKLEAQKLELETIRFELEEVLDQVIGVSAMEAAHKGLEFVVDVDPRIPQWLSGDPLRLSQVLTNLVSNAIKFSPGGHVLVLIELAEALDDTHCLLRFGVSDTGIGMSRAQIDRIFSPFSQADSSMTRRFGGTGLGLTISCRLVELMGGELTVESEQGQGSTFSFVCAFGGQPIQPASLAVQPEPRALVAEDHPLQAQALARMLGALGCNVVVVQDSASALDALAGARDRDQPIELAFLDHGLPDLSGLELARRIDADPRLNRLRSILVAPCDADYLISRELVGDGVAGVIQKPLRKSAVQREVEKVAARKKSGTHPSALPDDLGPSSTPLRGRRILVVQDSEVARDLVREILELGGAEVHVAVDGMEAVQRANRERFDLVLMDVHLPVLDGCAATRMIRSDPRGGETRIVAVTASADLQDRARCWAAGMDGYLATPVGAQDLLQAVSRWIAAERPVAPRTDRPSRTMSAASQPAQLGSTGSAGPPVELDIELALKRLDGNRALYYRLLRRFAGAHESTASDVRCSLSLGRNEEAVRAVHTLVASAANIGALRLYRTAQALEVALRGTPTDSLESMLVELEDRESSALAAVRNALENRANGDLPRHTATPGSEQPVRLNELQSTVARLMRQLEDYDTAAVGEVDTLLEALGREFSLAPPVSRLRADMHQYDFQRARASLEALEQWLETRGLGPFKLGEGSPPRDGSPRKPSVLLVDDSAESIDVLRGLLGNDYQVKATIDGSTAVDVAERLQPDLVLLDVMMPDLDGYEVCRRLKSNPGTERIPVMFVTTLSDPPSEARGLQLGAVDYITKPYVPSLVLSRVRTQVALHRQNLGLEALVKQRTTELVGTRLEIIHRLGRAAEYRDNETGMHVLRMSHVARLLALASGVGEAQAELILHAAPMHDIGKIGIPDRILLKSGSLDPAEWEQMKRHTIIGAEIIGEHPSELMKMARIIALRHHERWDGSGYPGGLKGLEIPESARIAALADVFDAVMASRPYKRAWTVAETLDYIKTESGRHFEPRLVQALTSVLSDCLAVRSKYRDD